MRRVVVVGAGMAGVADRRGPAGAGLRADRSRCSARSRTSPTTARRCPRPCCWARPTAPPSTWTSPDSTSTLRLGLRAVALRPGTTELITAEGPLPYDRLVLATGAQPVDAAGDGRTARACTCCGRSTTPRRCGPVLAAGGEVVVVGAGWIGAEFATAARRGGLHGHRGRGGGPPAGRRRCPPRSPSAMRGWYAEAGVRAAAPARRVAGVERGAVVLADGSRLPARAPWWSGSAPGPPPAGWPAPGVELDGDRRGAGRRPAAHLGARGVRGRRLRVLPVRPLRPAAAGPPLGQRGAGPAHRRRQPAGRATRRTTRCRTSGPSSSAASCSTPGTTATATRWSRAATRTAPPGRCAGCGTAMLVALLAVGPAARPGAGPQADRARRPAGPGRGGRPGGAAAGRGARRGVTAR